MMILSKKAKTKRNFFIGLNMQNPPNPEPMNWYVRRADDSSVPEYTVVGWEFTPNKREDSLGVIEGANPELNFRKAFLPEEGHYMVSRDFSGQELRILANLSGEQSWIETFLHNGDIHERTAKTLWGEENYDKTKRSMAKGINFGLVYGIGPMGLADQIGTSVEEAEEYINKFFELHPNIERYLNRQAVVAEKQSDLANHYGRKRRLHNYISSFGKLMPAGVRRAYNFPIQSMGADITKLGILSVYYNIVKNPAYEGKALWMSTIHDEINLSVSRDVLHEVVYKMGEAMKHTIFKDYPVPIITGLEIGNSMGLSWKFNQDPNTLELVPAYEELD